MGQHSQNIYVGQHFKSSHRSVEYFHGITEYFQDFIKNNVREFRPAHFLAHFVRDCARIVRELILVLNRHFR